MHTLVCAHKWAGNTCGCVTQPDTASTVEPNKKPNKNFKRSDPPGAHRNGKLPSLVPSPLRDETEFRAEIEKRRRNFILRVW